MKRNMDLVRDILFIAEKNEDLNDYIPIKIDGYSQEVISYHIKLMAQANLVEAIDNSDSRDFCWQVISLTWHGHEFLDAARDSSIWAKVKASISSKVASVPFEVFTTVLIDSLKKAVIE